MDTVSTLMVARQPILDVTGQTVAYELLFRGGPDMPFSPEAGDEATLSVIGTSFFHLGLPALVGNRQAFLNCTGQVLLDDYVSLLPRDRVVLEILETVEPTPEVLDKCRALKQQGFRLAMDDYIGEGRHAPFLDIVDIVKVDFLEAGVDLSDRITRDLSLRPVKLLAEKVETQPQYETARDLGFDLFQGYYFSKPDLVQVKAAQDLKTTKIRLLDEVYRKDFDLGRAEEIVKHDPSLAHQLLRYINSSYFGLSHEVSQIRQALALLGQRNLRKWLTILLVSSAGENKPSELVTLAVLRARFCENLADAVEGAETSDLFLLGLFSLIDAITDQPMETALSSIPLSEPLRACLLGTENAYAPPLRLIEALEKGDWPTVRQQGRALNLPDPQVHEAYREAAAWTESIRSNRA